jgi:hypothetical protein
MSHEQEMARLAVSPGTATLGPWVEHPHHPEARVWSDADRHPIGLVWLDPAEGPRGWASRPTPHRPDPQMVRDGLIGADVVERYRFVRGTSLDECRRAVEAVLAEWGYPPPLAAP